MVRDFRLLLACEAILCGSAGEIVVVDLGSLAVKNRLKMDCEGFNCICAISDDSLLLAGWDCSIWNLQRRQNDWLLSKEALIVNEDSPVSWIARADRLIPVALGGGITMKDSQVFCTGSKDGLLCMYAIN